MCHIVSAQSLISLINKVSYIFDSFVLVLQIVKSTLQLRWFCITTLSDWLKELSQLIRSKPKLIVTRFAPATCICFDWFTGLPVFFVIGQSDNVGFGLTTVSCSVKLP